MFVQTRIRTEEPLGDEPPIAADFNRMRPSMFHGASRGVVFTPIGQLLPASPNACGGLTEADLYEDNSGTTLNVYTGGKLIVASDTRHSAEYNINSRIMSRIYHIGPFFLTTTGFFADGFRIYTILLQEITRYEMSRPITLKATARLLMNVLYSRRFFPYYVYPSLSGFELAPDGTLAPVIYSFDSIGSYERVTCRCDGSGSKMVQPLLDSWIDGKNFKGFQPQSFDSVQTLIKKAYDAAAERDVKTKDYLELYVSDGRTVSREVVDLRKD